MSIHTKAVISSLLICLLTFSCVSTKQYKELQENSQKYVSERDLLKSENQKLSVKNTEMKSQLTELENDVVTLQEEIDLNENELSQLKKDYNLLNRRYFDLQTAQEDLIKGNVKETRRLLKELQTTQEALMAKEDELRQLEKSLNTKKTNLDELQFELAERNARLIELENILSRKDSIVSALKEKVSSALLGFENDGLSVTLKNGKVYVSLEEQLLFKTGSTDVDQNGVSALKKLTRVLETNPDINIMIEGHTDDVPYVTSGGPIKDNWDLSVKRATAIVRILMDGSTINPERLVAAGRGEFMPVDSAKTPEARQKNRRTEIILTPKLDELFRILENN
jgi:chemotaxis protein MotB